jgi:sodium/potassium/calcium exchanger 6
MFSFLAFVVSVIWIDLIANEIMAVLFTFGVVFQLSDAILGLTILAWGNSVGGNIFFI